MSRSIIETYYFKCDLCSHDECDEVDELPYGWETVERDIMLCASCFVEYDLLEDEDEKELYLRHLALDGTSHLEPKRQLDDWQD